jgi:hypothetical protein
LIDFPSLIIPTTTGVTRDQSRPPVIACTLLNTGPGRELRLVAMIFVVIC